jgi:predicted nucleotidyltransferase
VPPALRQRAVLDGIIERSGHVPSIDGLIVIGSFAGGEPDALSDLDLIAVTAPGRLDEAWDARHRLAGDVFVSWEPHSNEGRAIRWLNWLTHDLVKVECGIAAPGSKELAEPFVVVSGPPSISDAFPRIESEVIKERAAQRREEQRDFDPHDLTPEERLGWKLSEMKDAARALLRGERGGT